MSLAIGREGGGDVMIHKSGDLPLPDAEIRDVFPAGKNGSVSDHEDLVMS